VRAVLSGICWVLAVVTAIFTAAAFAGGGLMCQAGEHRACRPQTWLLVIGIVLVLLDANRSNEIVNALLDAGRWLAGPFDNVFKMDSHKATVAVNWGLAAAVYAVVGGFVARLLRR
jgi:hypothetical protein